MKDTKKNWKPVSAIPLPGIRTSPTFYDLPREAWLTWARNIDSAEKFCLRDYGRGLSSASTEDLSTSDATDFGILERYDRGFWKYYGYPLVRLRDGRCFQAGPIKDLPGIEHHERERVMALDETF